MVTSFILAALGVFGFAILFAVLAWLVFACFSLIFQGLGSLFK